MTLRITASACSFTASAVDQVAVSPVLNLNDYVSTKIHVRPTAITLVEVAPADLVVSQVLLRSTKNPEMVHRLYKGPKVPIGAVLGAIGRDSMRNEELTAIRFPSDHGVELVFTYDNGTTALTATFLWDIANVDIREYMRLMGGIMQGGQNAHAAQVSAAMAATGMPGMSGIPRGLGGVGNP